MSPNCLIYSLNISSLHNAIKYSLAELHPWWIQFPLLNFIFKRVSNYLGMKAMPMGLKLFLKLKCFILHGCKKLRIWVLVRRMKWWSLFKSLLLKLEKLKGLIQKSWVSFRVKGGVVSMRLSGPSENWNWVICRVVHFYVKIFMR